MLAHFRVGRFSRRVAIVMGPLTSETSPKVEGLKQQIPDLFAEGKKIDWQGWFIDGLTRVCEPTHLKLLCYKR